jgi:hypothetical protein
MVGIIASTMKSRFTLTIDPNLLHGIRGRAKKEGRKISQLIELWVRQELERRAA